MRHINIAWHFIDLLSRCHKDDLSLFPVDLALRRRPGDHNALVYTWPITHLAYESKDIQPENESL